MASPTASTSRRAVGPRCRRGIGLAESLLAAIVLAAAVVGIMGPISASHQQTRAMAESATALSLAQQVMEEIAARPLADPETGSTALGPETGEVGRAGFDNVDDYHNWTEDTTALRDAGGAVLNLWPDQGVYRRTVTVQYRATPDGSQVGVADFALVTVTVTTPSGPPVTLRRLAAAVTWTPGGAG